MKKSKDAEAEARIREACTAKEVNAQLHEQVKQLERQFRDARATSAASELENSTLPGGGKQKSKSNRPRDVGGQATIQAFEVTVSSLQSLPIVSIVVPFLG